jgi:alpha-L-fucosidase
MMERHRAQLVELLTNYGKINLLCLDMYLGPRVWPELRKTILKLREIQPEVMLRDRGIGNYGDYYTPERVVPGGENSSDKPWFCIFPLGTDFSYEADPAKYKGTEWIVHNLVNTVAKGGGLMVGTGPSAHGEFHPEALRQMRAAGQWLKVNGEAIYVTRPRSGANWSQGDSIRFTRSKDRRFIYAIMTVWPGNRLALTSLRPVSQSKVTLLGSDSELKWRWDSSAGTIITLPTELQDPSRRPCNFAWTIKLEASET